VEIMALKKEVDTKYGITAYYWKVGMISIDTNNKEGSFVLNLYVNDTAKEFIDSRVISFNEIYNEDGTKNTTLYDKYFKDETSEYDNIFTACYMCAKETDPFFTDAEDC